MFRVRALHFRFVMHVFRHACILSRSHFVALALCCACALRLRVALEFAFARRPCVSRLRVTPALRICPLHACVSLWRSCVAQSHVALTLDVRTPSLHFAFALSLACVACRSFRRVLARRFRIICIMLRLRMLRSRLVRCSCLQHAAAARRACGVRASPLTFTPLLGKTASRRLDFDLAVVILLCKEKKVLLRGAS